MTLAGSAASAADLPGEGCIAVQPLKSSIAEETFQTLLVMKGLEKLGYDVKPIKEIEYADGVRRHLANGDGTFLADFWDPLHIDFYKKAGGDAKLFYKGVYSPGALQGYLIDKKTAEKYNITNRRPVQGPEDRQAVRRQRRRQGRPGRLHAWLGLREGHRASPDRL